MISAKKKALWLGKPLNCLSIRFDLVLQAHVLPRTLLALTAYGALRRTSRLGLRQVVINRSVLLDFAHCLLELYPEMFGFDTRSLKHQHQLQITTIVLGRHHQVLKIPRPCSVYLLWAPQSPPQDHPMHCRCSYT